MLGPRQELKFGFQVTLLAGHFKDRIVEFPVIQVGLFEFRGQPHPLVRTPRGGSAGIETQAPFVPVELLEDLLQVAILSTTASASSSPALVTFPSSA